MEDQGKRLLIAVVAAMGIFLLWQVIFPSQKDQQTASGSGSASGSVVRPGGGTGTGAGVGTGAAAAAGTAAGTNGPLLPEAIAGHKRAPADELTIDDLPGIHVAFTKWGGDLISWQLKEERYETTKEHGELVSAGELGHGAFDVNLFAGGDRLIPDDAAWTGKRSGDTVVYTFDNDKLTVTKTYKLDPTDYLIKLDVQVQAKQAIGQPQLQIATWGYQDPADVVKAGRTTRQWAAGCLANGDEKETALVDLKAPSAEGGTIQWAGIVHPYFLMASALAPNEQQQMRCESTPAPTAGVARVALVFAPDNLAAGQTIKHSVWAYAGPKDMDKLEHADDVAGFKTGFSKSVSMGWFSFIARPLLWLLRMFYGWVGNWGIAIIMLTVLVKLATLYWTTKSMRSMRAMAALKPKMDELQKKYKDDRARQQQEMMALYKTHGVNPLAGCLPMVAQMPIWLALYRMLSNAGELYNAPFIPGWINDLTAKDPYYILGVALVVLMFVQAKLQPKTGDGMQQKIMMYVLPGVFGVMSLFFPSGLTLYILTNTMLTAVHSLYMRKWDKSAKMFPTASAVAVPAGSQRVTSDDDRPRAKVIDAEAVEKDDEDEDEGDEDDGDDKKPAARAAQKTTGSNRPRRGQRRRGRN